MDVGKSFDDVLHEQLDLLQRQLSPRIHHVPKITPAQLDHHETLGAGHAEAEPYRDNSTRNENPQDKKVFYNNEKLLSTLHKKII